MFDIIRAKFEQNWPLHSMLLATENDLIMEACTSEPYWAYQFDLNDSVLISQFKSESFRWAGDNRLGQLLMELRKEFRCDRSERLK
jgi:predicted NAD-dependent protein-ADP-ribosyltransferase YbiA (DUF1768 family)